jgi:uncharacterized protein (DUF983 family)
MSEIKRIKKILKSIETVNGYCEYCSEDSIFLSVVDDYYKCTNCGEDTKQYKNGSIRYLKLSEIDKEIIKQDG